MTREYGFGKEEGAKLSVFFITVIQFDLVVALVFFIRVVVIIIAVKRRRRRVKMLVMSPILLLIRVIIIGIGMLVIRIKEMLMRLKIGMFPVTRMLLPGNDDATTKQIQNKFHFDYGKQ